jgi:hypothetical protein
MVEYAIISKRFCKLNLSGTASGFTVKLYMIYPYLNYKNLYSLNNSCKRQYTNSYDINNS